MSVVASRCFYISASFYVNESRTFPLTVAASLNKGVVSVGMCHILSQVCSSIKSILADPYRTVLAKVIHFTSFQGRVTCLDLNLFGRNSSLRHKPSLRQIKAEPRTVEQL